jgi:hypothetical protein
MAETMARPDATMQRFATQVDETPGQPRRLPDGMFVVDRKGQGLCHRQYFEALDVDLDGAGGHG